MNYFLTYVIIISGGASFQSSIPVDQSDCINAKTIEQAIIHELETSDTRQVYVEFECHTVQTARTAQGDQ